MLAAIWDNKIDLIFFISIGFVIVVIALWFLFNGIYTKSKNKKAAKNLKKPTEINESVEEKPTEEETIEQIKEDISSEDKANEENVQEEASEAVAPIVVAEEENEQPEESTEIVQEESEPAQEESKEAESVEPAQEESTVKEEQLEKVEEASSVIEEKEETVESTEIVQEESEPVQEKTEELQEETPEETATPIVFGAEENEQPEETTDAESVEPTEETPVVEETPVKETKAEEAPTPIVEEEPKAEAKAAPVKKGRSYNGKYEVFQVADGYAYHLKASNGEILVSSETYASRDGVIKAIKAVQKNLETGEVRIFADKRGKYKFKLISKNYRVLAISSNYSVEKSAVRASESFKKFAQTADIVDIELDDTEIKTATTIKITATEDKEGGKFVIEKFDGEYSWDLKASNGQILCQAEGYTSKVGCTNSIEAFKKCVETGVFKCVKDKTGRYCYKLYTQNNRICAVGESYSSKQGAESAANSVASFYKRATIEEVKN